MITVDQNGLRMMMQEHAECVQCDSLIPRENTITKMDPKTGIQSVQGYCEHCTVLYCVRRQLVGGIWSPVGAVEAVNCKRRKDAFLRELGELHRDIQLQAAPPRKSRSAFDELIDQENDAAAVQFPGSI